MLQRLVRVSHSLAVLRVLSKTMKNRYGARGSLANSCVNVEMCSFPFVLSIQLQMCLQTLYIHILWDVKRLENLEHCVSIYRDKYFLEVDESNGRFFLVVSHFLDDASKSKNLRRCRSLRSKSALVWA